MKYLSLFLLFALPITAHAQINAFGLDTEISHNSIFVAHPMPPSMSDDSDAEPGVIYVFHRLEGEENSWELTSEITASDGSGGDSFGYQFEVDGNHLVVGAPMSNDGQGAVYHFTHNAETGGWDEVSKLSGSEDIHIGGSLAFSGTTVVTGAMAGVDSINSVHVYSLGEGGFEHSGSLTPDSVAVSDLFGASVAIADNGTIFVGAPGANQSAGAVYHFAPHGDMWHGQQILSGDHEQINAQALGATLVAGPDSFLLVGAPGIAPNRTPTELPPPGKIVWGTVNMDGFSPLQILDTGGQVPDIFGLGLSLDHPNLFAGYPTAGGQTGSVLSYKLDQDSLQWIKTGEIQAGTGDQLFGLIISSHGGNLIAVSAPLTNQGKGTVRVASLDEEAGAWSVSEPLKTGKEIVLVSSGAVDCADGTAGQFGCGNVDLLSFMTVADLGGETGVHANDVWGWVDPETNREYALVGRSNGTAFVDITDPINPVFKGDLPLTEGATPNSWRDIKVYANHAFIVADNAGEHGVQIFDLTHLRDDSDNPVTYSEDALYDGIASAHNIVINEETGFAYVVGSSGGGSTCGGGLHMLDIREPQSPVFVGCFADESTGRAGTGYSHDAQCLIYNGPDPDHQGKEICFNSNETALSISDVTDKENPIALSAADYPNFAYAHQGWVSDDLYYFYMNDELDELQGKVEGTRTLIWDISDLDDPQLANEFYSGNLSSDHNLYVHGNLMYQSNYMSGMRIFDISDRINPVEVGFFDTHPIGSDRAGFEGSWSNYPYFPSGTIIITSINEGLFIVRKQNIDI